MRTTPNEPMHPFASRTLSFADLKAPEIAPTAGALRRSALRLGLSGVPFAVNGVLKRRFWVRRHKMWEYAQGLACVQAERDSSQRRQGGAEGLQVLDFGGGATLPIFCLAEHGAEVLCLDVDAGLADWTNRVAAQRGWPLRASLHDLTQTPAPVEWGTFDAVISFSVLEHIPTELQAVALGRLAGLLRPGGVMAVTLDYGADAPQPFAVRDEAGVARLVAATGLQFVDSRGFVDTGERFALDKRHPQRRFTFASLFLRK